MRSITTVSRANRLHVVTLKKGDGTLLQPATYRYGWFGGILVADTAYVWHDGEQSA